MYFLGRSRSNGFSPHGPDSRPGSYVKRPLDLVPLKRSQEELVVNGKRKGVVAVTVSTCSPSGMSGVKMACLMSAASCCRSSLDPLLIRQWAVPAWRRRGLVQLPVLRIASFAVICPAV